MAIYQVGAIIYVAWGILHILAAAQGFRFAKGEQVGPAQGRLYQGAWNIGLAALAAIFVAVTMNWHNSVPGYWINLVMVSGVDIAFLIFVVKPGYMPGLAGVVGPALWVIAAVCSTIGITAAL